MNEKLSAIALKTGVGLLGAAMATNDVPAIYAQLDPHIVFWSRLFGLVLCLCSIVAVVITIYRKLHIDPNDPASREDE